MRKTTREIIQAFYDQKVKTIGNSMTDGTNLFLHGNKIAEYRADGIWITNAGWTSNVTKERLNGLNGVSISQKNWQWYLNDKLWGGGWTKIGQ